MMFEAAIVCDTDKCDVALKHGLAHQLGVSVNKNKSGVRDTCWAAVCVLQPGLSQA